MTTVLVCDDAPLAREAVRRAVSAVPGVERVSAAGSGEEVLARFPLERPGVVLMTSGCPAWAVLRRPGDCWPRTRGRSW